VRWPPTLLFYCQHSLGIGHLTRSFALCHALSQHFRVVLLSGGVVPDSLTPPEGVEIVELAPLGAGSDGKLVSRDPRRTVEEAQELRRRTLLETLDTTQPRAIFIELFPFGRRKFAAELVPLLEAARALPERPVVVSSVRDILVGRGDEQRSFDDQAAARANSLFDAVLVHADRVFARLEESFRPGKPLKIPVAYTGFVVPERCSVPLPMPERRLEIVVSAGGGRVGAELLGAALDAQQELWPLTGLSMKLVAGPFLAEPQWLALEQKARTREGVELLRSVPDLATELCGARASVSQCGYNTALDLLSSEVPALVVPFSEPGQDEQSNRARRLERLGAVRVLDSHRLGSGALTNAIKELLAFEPSPQYLDLDGAQAAARVLADMAGVPRVPRLIEPKTAKRTWATK